MGAGPPTRRLAATLWMSWGSWVKIPGTWRFFSQKTGVREIRFYRDLDRFFKTQFTRILGQKYVLNLFLPFWGSKRGENDRFWGQK